MSDYWYEHRDMLQPGHVCIMEDGSKVKLDRRVPGDGTDWYVLDWVEKFSGGYWSDENSKIHPSEIAKGPPF